ncbi:MAG: MarR family transcriptional regulator [Candidatus Portnoybacteria bacterium]|nr:MarR family transcriptional regulator [Candidatus Portnoybacteria bacterium]
MKEVETLPLEMRKLGLTEKEVRVYLAALELGYTSVQEIAKKAQISRPTAYEIIKSLENKELISQSKEKGKRYFTAQSPDNLLGILKRQRKELEEKEREFIRIIAALRAKYYLNDKREIKVYQGKSGLEILLDDFLTTHSKEIYVLAADNKIWPISQRRAAYKKIKKRLGQIEVKELVGKVALKETVIIYDKVIILSPQKTGLLIENKTVVNLIKSLFLFIFGLIQRKG